MRGSGQSNAMQAAEQYADRKTELEAKIRSLESERSFLVSDIAALKERVAELELEKQANALQGEVDALRTEKAVLEEKAATYDAGASFAVPTSAAAGL